MSSVVVKSIDEAAVRLAVDEYAARLFASHPEVEEIVVFGSFANGTYAPGSDIDLFIMLDSCTKDVWDRLPDFLPGAFPVGLDIFPYTRDEFTAMLSSPIVAEVRGSTWRYRRQDAGSGHS